MAAKENRLRVYCICKKAAAADRNSTTLALRRGADTYSDKYAAFGRRLLNEATLASAASIGREGQQNVDRHHGFFSDTRHRGPLPRTQNISVVLSIFNLTQVRLSFPVEWCIPRTGLVMRVFLYEYGLRLDL